VARGVPALPARWPEQGKRKGRKARQATFELEGRDAPRAMLLIPGSALRLFASLKRFRADLSCGLPRERTDGASPRPAGTLAIAPVPGRRRTLDDRQCPGGSKHHINPSDRPSLAAFRPSDHRLGSAPPSRESLASAMPPPTECLRKAPLYGQDRSKEARRRLIVKNKREKNAFLMPGPLGARSLELTTLPRERRTRRPAVPRSNPHGADGFRALAPPAPE
jgi:hypothetical protein